MKPQRKGLLKWILHRGPSQQKCFFEFIDFNIPKLTGKYRYGGYIMKSCS